MKARMGRAHDTRTRMLCMMYGLNGSRREGAEQVRNNSASKGDEINREKITRLMGVEAKSTRKVVIECGSSHLLYHETSVDRAVSKSGGVLYGPPVIPARDCVTSAKQGPRVPDAWLHSSFSPRSGAFSSIISISIG